MRRIRSNYVLQVHKVTSGEVLHNFINDSWFLYHVATWTSHVATSFLTLSATSRRGPTRRDVKITCLCHVATWTSHVATSFLHFSVTSRCGFTRRDMISYMSLSRRDVASNVATWIKSTLCHVATWPPTSRCRLVKLSVTSRRDPARRDVALV